MGKNLNPKGIVLTGFIVIVFFYSNLSSRILVNIYYLFYLHIVTRVIGNYAEIKILDRKQEGVMCSKRIIY